MLPVVLSYVFDLDIVLGAFAAGLVLRYILPGALLGILSIWQALLLWGFACGSGIIFSAYAPWSVGAYRRLSNTQSL